MGGFLIKVDGGYYNFGRVVWIRKFNFFFVNKGVLWDDIRVSRGDIIVGFRVVFLVLDWCLIVGIWV